MEAIGPVLLVLSLPLIFRWVPRNRLYGFRVAVTLRSDSIWYDANALAGRYMFALGLLMVVMEFLLPLTGRSLHNVLAATAVIGVILMTFIVWRAAYRWERERGLAS